MSDSSHPGGLRLTERLGSLLGLTLHSRVLDIAGGKGTTAPFLAERFGCEVVGIDYSAASVEQAIGAASAKGLFGGANFRFGYAEHLPFTHSSFDVVICE